MTDKKNTINLLQRCINKLAIAAEWEESAMVKAVSLGLEGEKRKNRYESTMDTNIRKYFQTAAFDIFETELYPDTVSRKNLENIKDPESFFAEYLKFLWEFYDTLTTAANQFVAPLCFRKLAQPLYCRADCLLEEIICTQRRLKRGRKNGFGHDLDVYEYSWENVHDKYEGLENAVGYEY